MNYPSVSVTRQGSDVSARRKKLFLRRVQSSAVPDNRKIRCEKQNVYFVAAFVGRPAIPLFFAVTPGTSVDGVAGAPNPDWYSTLASFFA